MIIAAAVIEESKLKVLDKLGVKDSKLLTHKKRILICKKLRDHLHSFEILTIYPEEIDSALTSDSLNLNWLEAQKSVELINTLNPNKVILDSPSPNLRAYKNYVYELLKNKKIELVVEHKADLNHKIVAAASILAKCKREEEMDKIKAKYGNTGPGYSSNPITQKFIKENFEKHPEIFRKSWSTFKNLVKVKNQKKLDEF